MNDIVNLIRSGHTVSYKLLSIGTFKYDGVTYIQVHCDRRDLEFSYMFSLEELRRAAGKYLSIHSKYIASESKYGKFPPIETEGKRKVSK